MRTPLTVTSKALPDGMDRLRTKAPRPDTAKKSDPDSGEATMYVCMYVCMYARFYDVSVTFETIRIYFYYTPIAKYSYVCMYACMHAFMNVFAFRILLPSSGNMKGSTWSMFLSSYESPWSTL